MKLSKLMLAVLLSAGVFTTAQAAGLNDNLPVNITNGTYMDGRCGSVAYGASCTAVTTVKAEAGSTLVVDGTKLKAEDLKGAKGDKGDQGVAGRDGKDGRNGRDGVQAGVDYNDGLAKVWVAQPDQSAHVISGIVTKDYLDNHKSELKGDKGEQGVAGRDGLNGKDGKDGVGATVVDNGDGTVTVTGSNGSATITQGSKYDDSVIKGQVAAVDAKVDANKDSQAKVDAKQDAAIHAVDKRIADHIQYQGDRDAGQDKLIAQNKADAAAYTDKKSGEAVKSANVYTDDRVAATSKSDREYSDKVVSAETTRATTAEKKIQLDLNSFKQDTQNNFGAVFSQLGRQGQRIDKLEADVKELNRGLAATIAMTHIPQSTMAGRVAIGVGVGNFRHESAFAIGGSYLTENQRVSIKVSAGYSGLDSLTVGAGASYIFP